MPSFDFVKDDCAVESAFWAKGGIISVVSNGALSCKTNGKKFSELTESAAMGFSMMCVMLQAVYTTGEKEFRTIFFFFFFFFLIFNFLCLVLTQKKLPYVTKD